MRRIFPAFLLVVMIFSLSACTGNQTFILKDFQRDISFETGGITVKGSLDCKAGDKITFTVKEPENISGIVFTTDEISAEDIKINYGKTGERSPVKMLLMILSDIASKEISIPLKGEYTHTDEFSSAGYKVVFDCEKSEIKSIETEKYTYNFE